MSKRTVVILQDVNICNELTERFCDGGEYDVIGKTDDGEDALRIIAERKPDFLITELVIHGYDGLSVIEKTRKMGLGTKIIVLSALCREEIVSKAIAFGADYFMAKPYRFSFLIDRMKAMDREPKYVEESSQRPRAVASLDEKISNIFINVGIPPHIKGYTFLREGVKMTVDNPSVINHITKQLYPMIGEKYETTASKVERAIRHAIEVAWNRGRIESINGILGVRAYVGSEKPTNGEFIALVADKMMLEMV